MSDYLYHVSPKSNRDSIFANGLDTDYDRTGMGCVFLTDSVDCSSEFDLWSVRVGGLDLEEDWTTDESGCWMYFGSIPTDRLALRTPIPV
jgi:hypothetical protein